MLSVVRKLCSDNVSERYHTDKTMDELKVKEPTQYQLRLIHDRSKARTLYVKLLDLMIFEFAKIIVGNVHNNYVFELLENYLTPHKIGHAHFNSLLKIKYVTSNKVSEIQEIVRLTIGISSALQLEMKQLFSTIRHLTSQIDEI